MRLVAMICLGLMVTPVLPPVDGSEAAADGPSTFSSERWGIALEYPAAWSVEDDGDEVTFRSIDGQSIVLGRVATDNPSEPGPRRRSPAPQCSTLTTSHGVTGTVCVDTASQTRRAVLVLKTRDGVESRLAIRMRGGDARNFDAIVSSARRYP